MSPSKRAELLFDQAKQQGMVNPITGDGVPSISMVTDAIHDAENDGYQRKCGDEAQRTIRVQKVLRDLDHRVHSGYDFNADPDGMTPMVSEALKL